MRKGLNGSSLSVALLILWTNQDLFILPVQSSRAYPLGCSREDSSYYDYDNYPFPPPGVPVKSTQDYNILERLGNGKFSDVFSAIPVKLKTENEKGVHCVAPDPNHLVVIKCLKPVTDRKIRRELLVLQHASQLPNLARLEAVVLHPDFYTAQQSPGKLPRMPSFVLKHAGPNTQFFCHPTTTTDDYLSDYEIQYFLFHLLVALDALHSKGMMHRDVKPRNILIARQTQSPQQSTITSSLMLIDLGLADFYLPNTRYNVRVASRHYKAPELLIGYPFYGYGVDLWPVGCILAGTLFRREPFFRGKDNDDQLAKIVSVLGTRDLRTYLRRIQHWEGHDDQVAASTPLPLLLTSPTSTSTKRVPWLSFLRAGCPVPSGDALDLLDKLLVYDHDARLTAKEAMDHPFFDPVRDRVLAEIALWEQQQQQQQESCT